MQIIGKRHRNGRRGAAIVTALVFIVVISLLIMGIGSYATSHQQRAIVDERYNEALDLAEAAVNYEFRKISMDASQRDYGGEYAYGDGTFQVWCVDRNDPNLPWDGVQNQLVVVANGTVDGVTRTVRVSAKGYDYDARYALYSIDSRSSLIGSTVTVNGDVGTNDLLYFNARPIINGAIAFNGDDAGWAMADPGGYNVYYNPKPVEWKTCAEIAAELYPNGGLSWIMNSANNSNSRAIPPIVNNRITTATTLPPGDYYVTEINLTGSNQVYFNNTTGPVRVWVGPPGATSGTYRFRGGTAAVPLSADASKAPYIYMLTEAPLDMAGNSRFDGIVYAYNKREDGTAYGSVTNSGNPQIHGQIIANSFQLNGNCVVNYVVDLIKPKGPGYFGYDDAWDEVGGR